MKNEAQRAEEKLKSRDAPCDSQNKHRYAYAQKKKKAYLSKYYELRGRKSPSKSKTLD